MELTRLTLVQHPTGSVTTYTLRALARGNHEVIVLPMTRRPGSEPVTWLCRVLASDNIEFPVGEGDLMVTEHELLRSPTIRFGH